ncbi:aldehyde dehydrogenase family protein [Rhodococcus sp. IEGM 1307]|jgi:aldehyde dehydrogenase (NAD+)|uniref:aldehyde dehydrogenase family protein n=1 Tax=Rhodococcus sp. IEGM 1307 TaxID=3047091 RepID=UPI0024B84794|nr:aldehyde dehydrogenase family protein [Rhodococcus sp. IEGM 1307]MDI9977208.1 aldehyde dehydrogenase family protein [Rhodococcus sp. IEGM 1307]
MTSTQVAPASLGIPAARDFPMLIDGRWVEAISGEWTEVTTPILRDHVIGRVPTSEAADVDRAVAAARAAFPAWRAQHFTSRARVLGQIADAIEARIEDLASLTALDTGNAIRTQARPEAQTLANLFRYFAGIAGESKGVVLPAGDDQLQYTRLEPLGVVGAILPWNSPLMIAGFKIPAALATGNTVVVKAAEAAPLSVLLLAEICAEFLPAGVLNVITGLGSVAGERLVQHPGVDKVSFTGSTEVGRHVAQAAGERLAHVSLELGGKNPSIVFPDAADDDDLIGDLLLSSRVHRQGQSCTAGSRLFLHEDIYDDVLGRLTATLGSQVVGNPLDESTDMGAIINDKQFRSVTSYVEDGLAAPGITVALDGSVDRNDGFYLAPTIFAGANNDWRLSREEIFGPVVVVIPWKDEAEVIKMANDSHYGLAAYVWTHDLDRAIGTANALETGWVQVNQGGGQMVGQSYGGYKQSGIGREASLEGMLAGFTQTKQINVRLRTAR